MSNLWIENQLDLTIGLESQESAFYELDTNELFNLPVFKRKLFPGDDVEVIRVEYLGDIRYRNVNQKDTIVWWRVVYKKRLEFVNPNAPITNQTHIAKFPPTKRSEVDNIKRRFFDRFDGTPFSLKQTPWRYYVTIIEAIHQVLVSPALEASLYSNEEIAEANVLVQRQQERQEANKVVAKSVLAGSGVSKTIKNFLGGRRRQTRRKNTRKQSRRK